MRLSEHKNEHNNGAHTLETKISVTTIDKIHLNCDCFNGSILNGIRCRVIFSFALNVCPGHWVIERPRRKKIGEINRLFFNFITYYPEDNDCNVVDFTVETIIFTVLLVRI